jgi:methionine biosynthesis protein MetW
VEVPETEEALMAGGLIRRLRGYPAYSLPLTAVDYDQYWRDKRKGDMGALTDFQRRRAEIVASMVEDGASVVDIGCGNGAILEYLREHRRIKGIAVDRSPLALEHVGQNGFQTVAADISDPACWEMLPEADYVLALEVIEHLPNAEQVVAMLAGKARKALILSIPNTGYFVHRLRLLCGRFPAQWRLHPGEHLRFWTLADARWWVRAMELPSSTLVPYEGIPFLNRLLPSWFAAGLIMNVKCKNSTVAGRAT